MTPEQFFIDFLNGNLNGVQAYGDEPQPAPERFVTVEQVGGGEDNLITRADIAVQSWAQTRAEAAELNQTVIATMKRSVEESEISKCHLDTTYNFTDATKKRPRYQAIFEVIFSF